MCSKPDRGHSCSAVERSEKRKRKILLHVQSALQECCLLEHTDHQPLPGHLCQQVQPDGGGRHHGKASQPVSCLQSKGARGEVFMNWP